MVLTYAEEIELRYLFLKGFTYLVRNEIGSINVFVNKPHRDKETNYIPTVKLEVDTICGLKLRLLYQWKNNVDVELLN